MCGYCTFPQGKDPIVSLSLGSSDNLKQDKVSRGSRVLGGFSYLDVHLGILGIRAPISLVQLQSAILDVTQAQSHSVSGHFQHHHQQGVCPCVWSRPASDGTCHLSHIYPGDFPPTSVWAPGILGHLLWHSGTGVTDAISDKSSEWQRWHIIKCKAKYSEAKGLVIICSLFSDKNL